MIWECEKCGIGMMEYACLGHGSLIDNGCPECGHTKIWFVHLGYPASNPNTRVLIDVVEDPKKILKEQTAVVTTTTEWI